MDEKKKVKEFWRIWKYVWPQWHRLAAIVFTALLVGILFSLSFMTVIPLLKVMMREEGLHNWIDRKTCQWRYGMDFYVPDTTDLMSKDTEMAHYLRVNSIEEESKAEAAGLKMFDKIVGVGAEPEGGVRPTAANLLEMLAKAQDGAIIKLDVQRTDPQGGQESVTLDLVAMKKPDDVTPAELSFVKRVEWGFKWAVIQKTQWISSLISREDPQKAREKSIRFIILLMACVTTIRCLATFYQKYLAEKVVQIAIAGVRKDIFTHVMYMPVGYFSSEGTSDTISRILGDTSGTGKGVKILLGKALREPMKAVFCLLGAMFISWQLTLIFLAAAPLTIGLLGLIGRRMKKASKRSLMTSAIMLGRLQDSIKALRVVKVYNRQAHEVDTFGRINQTFLRRVIRIAKLEAGTGPLMEFFGMLAGTAALLVGAHWVCRIQNSMDGSDFIALLVLLGTSAESVRKASDVWNRVQEANAAAERVYEIVDGPMEMEVQNAADLKPLQQTIEFKDIVFTYPKSSKPVLNHVNLTVKAGQTVAVVGPNGSGKTTLVNLLPRFYDPDSGQILIDGQDIHEATLSSLRDQIGMVTQNVVTFNDTVYANIGYGKEDVTESEIVSAAKRAYCHEFIEPLEKGYETVIGEHGSGFSGGQLQRMVIARAIVKNPPILIFDEAMSQIDADSEAKINEALGDLMHGRTCFVIAHRFSTVVSADSIVVMENGGIIAQGTHDELIEKCSLYRSLYETQLIAT